MKKPCLFAFYAVLSLWTLKADAQCRLGFGAQGMIGFPDTVTAGDTINTAMWILNKGDSVFSGNIIVTVYTSAPSPQEQGTLPVTGFKPNDSTVFNTSFKMVPPEFNPGNNIVVVWPTGLNALTNDIIMKPVFVLPKYSANGNIDDDPSLKNIILYPNPFKNEIILFADRFKNEVEQVRVMSAVGEEVMVLKNLSGTRISTPQLQPGIYFVEISLNDGRKALRRIIKSE